jgi:hypothetical protein
MQPWLRWAEPSDSRRRPSGTAPQRPINRDLPEQPGIIGYVDNPQTIVLEPLTPLAQVQRALQRAAFHADGATQHVQTLNATGRADPVTVLALTDLLQSLTRVSEAVHALAGIEVERKLEANYAAHKATQDGQDASFHQAVRERTRDEPDET